MSQKTTVGLIVALAAALLGLWWAQSSSGPRTPAQPPGPKALFDPPLDEIIEFEVVSAGTGTPLKFVQENGKWRMASPFEGPCDMAAVSGDVTKIRDLKYTQVYPAGHADRPDDQLTSLANPHRSIKLVSKDGKSAVLKIGSVQALSSRTYVQKQGDDSIYVVDADLNADLKRGLAEYRSRRLAEFPQTDAVRVEISGDRNMTLVKSDKGWTIESPIKGRADATAVNNILRAVTNLSALAFVEDNPKTWRPYGLDPARLTVAVTVETKTPKPAPSPPASAPAEPEFDIKTDVYKYSFGAAADDKVFVRVEQPATPTVLQVAQTVLTELSPELDGLRDKTVADLPSAKVQKIVYTAGGESVELLKENLLWRIAGPSQDGEQKMAEFAAVADLLKALGDLKAVGFESTETPAQGLDKPRATIEVTLEGSVEPLKLAIGGMTRSKTGAYIKNLRDGTIAVVTAEAAEALALSTRSFVSRELLQFNREHAASLSIVREGQEYRVEKDGAAWKFASPVQGMADAAAVANILVDLANLRGRKVVAGANEAATFGLDNPSVRATLVVQPPPAALPASQPTSQPGPPSPPPAEPPVTYTLLASRKNGKAYAMLEKGAIICEVDVKVIDDLEKELLDTAVISFAPSQVRKVAFDGETDFAFEKTGDLWRLVGEDSFNVDPVKITELATALHDLRAKGYARYANAELAAFGLDRPLLTMTIETDEGPSVLTISAKGPTPVDRYATVSRTPGRVFVLKAEDLPKFIKTIKDFQRPG